MHALTYGLIYLTAVLLAWRWFHVIVSKKSPKPLTKLDIKRNELLEAERVLFSEFLYLKTRQFSFSSPNDAGSLLLEKVQDISDALEALNRYPQPEDEEKPLLTHAQNRILDDVLLKARDRAVDETLGSFDQR